MPRRARITLANVPHHIIQRGNNRGVCFFTDDDYFQFLEWLEKYSLESDSSVHAYVLMTNHIHLLVTPKTDDGLAKLMKSLGQRYVQYINRKYRRTGTLWEGRFKSCITREDNYVLSCYRYIELNPVRIKIGVGDKWESFTSVTASFLEFLIKGAVIKGQSRIKSELY